MKDQMAVRAYQYQLQFLKKADAKRLELSKDEGVIETIKNKINKAQQKEYAMYAKKEGLPLKVNKKKNKKLKKSIYKSNDNTSEIVSQESFNDHQPVLSDEIN